MSQTVFKNKKKLIVIPGLVYREVMKEANRRSLEKGKRVAENDVINEILREKFLPTE